MLLFLCIWVFPLRVSLPHVCACCPLTPIPAFLLPVVLCRAEALCVFPWPLWHVHWCLPCSVVLVRLCVASDITRRKSQQTPDRLALKFSPPPLLQCSLNLRCGSFWDWVPQLYTLIGWVFYSGLCLSRSEVSLMKGGDYTYLWVWGHMFIDC